MMKIYGLEKFQTPKFSLLKNNNTERTEIKGEGKGKYVPTNSIYTKIRKTRKLTKGNHRMFYKTTHNVSFIFRSC